MNLRRRFLLLAVILAAGLTVNAAKAAELNLAAAASLKECMNEIIVLYKTAAPNVKVVANYEASGTLQKQIENGAAADVFISANQEKMDILEQKGFTVKETRKNLLKNKVVLIVPKNAASPIKTFADLGSDKLKEKGLAIGDPKVVPAGKYATDIFKTLKIEDKVMPKTVLAQNVRAVLAYVAQQEVDAGIVYLTDAMLMKDKVVVVDEAPEKSHEPTIYPSAVIKTGGSIEDGKSFQQFLFSEKSAALFKKYGFETVSEKGKDNK
ncbi:MAG: molybdate ABC transporter substrate-binding protein [Planctomycetaceae bacterium]|jgi:molybdate transport system substrate-binding protein|nr:molybdate ABC transporter substrate-binding protein [Planctomycetaceae bacterium]